MRRQLQSLGLAGVLAYGILNTLYYTTAFLSIWVWAVGAPRGEPLFALTTSDPIPSHCFAAHSALIFFAPAQSVRVKGRWALDASHPLS